MSDKCRWCKRVISVLYKLNYYNGMDTNVAE